ncbi:MAG: FecR domain-containing protein [Pseudomonadota bacterium]|nr:FecR domain-containing protein [Pseudomonadota bacterium]
MSTRFSRDSDDRMAALWADERRSGSWTPDRQDALEAWLAARPDRGRLLREHEALIADPAVLWAARRAAHATRRRPAPWSSPTFTWAVTGVAATVTACALMYGVLAPRGELIVGQRGAPEPVALADGSAVRLNGASQVRVVLGARERRLQLEGEGFFEVAPDKARPFSVVVHGVRVTAVGTRFNVDTLETPGGPVIEVVVFEGIVDVAPADGPGTRVRAGERAEVVGGRVHRTVLQRAEAETAIPSWANGWLELDEATLLSVVDDLERATGVRVSLSDPRIGRALVSGRFSYDHPEHALAAIARVHGLKLTRVGPDRFLLSDA